MQRLTPLMASFLIGELPESNCSLVKARAHFASVSLLDDSRFKGTRGIHSFRVSGSIYHKLGAMTPPPEHTPQLL